MAKSKGYRIRYQTITVTLPFDPRKHICDACGKSTEDGEIKSTQLHHWIYAYKPATVKKHPELALENTNEYCYYDHQIADGIRALLTANPSRVAEVIETLPFKEREKILRILQQVLQLENPEARKKIIDERMKKIMQKFGVRT